jgi:hypothetical protein
MNLGYFAIDLGPHRDGRVGLDCADRMELNRDGLLDGLGDQDRDRAGHEAARGVGSGLGASDTERGCGRDRGPDSHHPQDPQDL